MINKKIKLTFFLILTAVIVAFYNCKIMKNSKCYKNIAKNERFLYIGTAADFPPYEFKENGEIVGFDIDVTTEIAKRLGMKPIYSDLAFETLILDLNNGNIDIIAAAMGETEERKSKIFFSDAYVGDSAEDNDLYIVVTMEKDKINSLDDLIGKKVIGVDGYTSKEYLEKTLGGKIDMIGFGSSAEAILALINKKGFAFIGTKNVFEPIKKEHPDKNFNVFEIKVKQQFSFGISKANVELLYKVNKIIGELKKEGLIQNLKKKWNIK